MRKSLLFVLSLLFIYTANAQTPQYSYTNNATGGNYIPLGVGSGWGNYRSQFLYFPGDFSPAISGPGFITTIYFKTYTGYSGSGSVFNDFTVAVGNTSVTSLGTTYLTGLTPAFYSAAWSLPSAPGGAWFAIPLTTPVYVDFSQPVVIDVSQTGGSVGMPIYAGGTPVNPIYTGNTHSYGLTSAAPSCTPRRYSYQFGFDFFAGYPCTDTPKSLVDAPTPVCPNKPFKIQPVTFYSNASYQWQMSYNGTSWTNYTGPIGLYADIKDSITQKKYYRCIITCIATGKSYTTPAKLVDIAPFYYCYCDNGATAALGVDVGNVKVLAMPSGQVRLDNGTSTPATVNSGAKYTYSTFQYSVPPVVLYRDSTFKFQVSAITSATTMPATVNVAVYVDINRNGIYEATDRVMLKKITASSTVPNTESNTFTIPHSAEIGLTGMRVIASTGNPDSCGFGSAEGETEDYLVDMRYEPCKGPSNAGTVVSDESALCPDYDYMVTDTTYEKKKSELQRLWQVSADNIGWTNVNSSNDQDQLSKVFTGQPLYYRVRMVCPRTSDTTYSTVYNVKAKDGYKCYCYSQAIGGNVLDSSDIGGITIGDYTMNIGGPHLLNGLAHKKRTDHTDDTPIELFADSTYIVTAYHTMYTQIHGDAKVTIFIDYNNNKQYDMPYERVFTGYTSMSNFTIADTFTIPSVVIAGVPTGMRIILNNNITPNVPSDEACGGYISGETHDFMVVLNKLFPAGVNGIGDINNFGLFPNPTDGKFKLQFYTTKASKDVQVTITNVTGQVVMTKTYEHNGGQFTQEIDMSQMTKGVYFVELKADGEKATQKLVVK
ncbi:MAG: T9SS type A sorting domain-containing protein [Bacteroidetes bacterium]|nr:T9SS type A sorting domain-containing protein [Bacteroidota bacterium]